MMDPNTSEIDIKELLAIGEQLLEKNVVPDKELMDIIDNTSIGFDLFMILLARSQASDITKTFAFMSKLEDDIFDYEKIENKSDYEKSIFHERAMKSLKFRIDFMKGVQDRSDMSTIKTGILKMLSKDKIGGSGFNSENSKPVKDLVRKLMEVVAKKPQEEIEEDATD